MNNSYENENIKLMQTYALNQLLNKPEILLLQNINKPYKCLTDINFTHFNI